MRHVVSDVSVRPCAAGGGDGGGDGGGAGGAGGAEGGGGGGSGGGEGGAGGEPGGGGGGGQGGGGGGEGGPHVRGPQSAQSWPVRQKEKELPGPPSSHVPSEAWTQLLSQHA